MSQDTADGPQTWFDPSDLSPHSDTIQDTAFHRLWRGFMTARVMVALVLLALQALQVMVVHSGQYLSAALCAAYLVAVLVTRLVVKPVARGPQFDRRWQMTIGLDLVTFAVLQGLNPQSVNYAPLLALPVLLASVMGSLIVALGTAAAVTLYLLGLAWQSSLLTGIDFVPAFFQAGLTGIGYFGVAILANQLATRLIREEELTERSQRAIRLQAQVNELVIEALSQGVIVVDTLGLVRAANPAARQLLIAPQHGELVLPFALDSEPGWKALKIITTTTFFRKTAQANDLIIKHRDAPARRVHVKTRLTSNGARQQEDLCVAFIEDLPELEARLRQEKMVSMGRMSAAVAHEIRNPLAAISQANALLAEDLTAPEQLQLTSMIGQNAQRLARIVEDVLNVARAPRAGEGGDAGEFSTHSLALDEAVQRFTLDWSRQNKSSHKTCLMLGAADCQVSFDPEHLRRVLVNLLDNALRYSGQHPRSIVVTTGGGRLRVWSDGAPLDLTVQKHLFEPFFSSESRSSGLGLYICRELCERHGAALSYSRESATPDAPDVQGNCFQVDMKVYR